MIIILSNLTKRPLLLAFVGMIAFAAIWYRFAGGAGPAGGGGIPTTENVPVKCVGTIDGIQNKKSGKVLVLSDVRVINTNSEKTVSCEKILIYDSSEQNLFANSRQGNIIECMGTYSPFERAGNPGEFDEFTYYGSRKIGGRIFADSYAVRDGRYDFLQHVLDEFRQKMVECLFGAMEEDDAGLMCAMLLGEKTYLPDEEKELYQRIGIGHMLVISGLHISLLAAGLFFFLRRFVMPMRPAVIVTVVFLCVYGKFTGFELAASRAVLMMCCALFARYTGRCYDPPSALSFSGIVTLVQEPEQLLQCGFLLSYTAVAGILLFAPVMERAQIKSKAAQAFFSSASVSVATLPVMLWFYHEICPYSVLVNMVVLPFLSLLIGVGATGGIFALFCPAGGAALLETAHYILRFYEMVCRLVSQLPYSSVVTGRPPLWCVVLYYAILVLAVCFYLKRDGGKRPQSLAAGAAALCVCLFFFRPEFEFLYTQLDVGQGDCACVFYEDRTYLIDAGSSSKSEIGKYTVQKFLKFYGRSRIDAVFVSHSDADHTNGIVEMAEHQADWGILIDKAVLPAVEKRDENYEVLVRTLSRYGVPVYYMKKGDRFREGEFALSCLHPYPGYGWENENDYSLTLDLSCHGLRILCTGDLEESGEREIIENGVLPQNGYDVLKVGHHGSKTSTSDVFLQAVSPKYAFISAEKKNRYGHPAGVTLDRLSQAGAKIFSTIEGGAVMIEADSPPGMFRR